MVLLGGLGGYFAGQVLSSPPQPPETPPEEKVVEPAPLEPGETLAYLDLEKVTVNLNDPGLRRFLLARLTLAVNPGNVESVEKALSNHKPEVQDRLAQFFSECSLEQVRGVQNRNRIKRELRDALNQLLWPEQPPLIVSLLIKEFVIQ